MSAALRVALYGGLLLVVGAAAQAGDRFERKAGLWKITMHGSSAASSHSSDLCLAADTDARVAKQESATLDAMCSKREEHKVGTEFVTDTVCKIGPRTSTSHTVTTVTGDSAYRAVITTHDNEYTVEGHWAGACPSELKPGDQILHAGSRPGAGMKTNILAPPVTR